jgi:DNA-binding MarR family transcriptional regulator
MTKGQPSAVTAPRNNSRPRSQSRRNLVDDFLWQILMMNNDLEDISYAWARMLGINVHQWMILMAVRALDEGVGASVKAVSVKLYADSSFVTAQSKVLEKLGLLKRETSEADARVVLMSLTPKATEQIDTLRSTREPLETSVFGDKPDAELSKLIADLDALRSKFNRVAKRLAAEL